MMRAMSLPLVLVFAVVVLGCSSKSDESKAPRKAKPKPAQPVAAPEPPPPPPADAEPALTPEEVETARRQAMLDGRDRDVIKYCEMAGIEAGKSDEQALLGCTLAACRVQEKEKAQAWSTSLSRPMMKQAKRICMASSVPL